MGKEIDELLARMRTNPSGVRFAEACKVVTWFFGKPRQTGSSHQVWKMLWAGDPRINLQPGRGGQSKPYQIRQVVEAIDRLLQEKKP